MSRGRLIFPFLCDLARLDTAATAADPDAGGALTSGYDPDFREPLKRRLDVDEQATTSTRVESAVVQIRAQIEPDMFETLEMMLSGQSPQSRFRIVLHYRDLERASLIDAVTGRPQIRKNDRLVAIRKLNNALIETIPNPPGLFIDEVQSRGFGPGGARNLLLLQFASRDTSVRAAGS